MRMNRKIISILLASILVFSQLTLAYAQIGADFTQNKKETKFDFDSGFITIPDSTKTSSAKRYLVFGNGAIPDLNLIGRQLYGIQSENGFFSVMVLSQQGSEILRLSGYNMIEDFMVDLHSEDATRIGMITNSDKVSEDYGYTGRGVTVGIVDTGVDFSNPDLRDSVARDANKHPIMLDADGQGIVLTNATFIASIDDNGLVRNYSKDLPVGITSRVYVNEKGVFLDIAQKGRGTDIDVYNSFYPVAGNSPIFEGSLGDDWKIGQSNRDYIQSKSGIYRLGMVYQGSLSGPLARVQVVPVLVTDPNQAGVYDTITPDMSTSYEDFMRVDLPAGKKPKYDFDFTDEKPIVLGSGNEFLVYDSDKDGKADYSAGIVGARVVDVYNVINKKEKTQMHDAVGAVNGTLLAGLDDGGEYFGIMTDTIGHGTSSAASIASRGVMEYDIYNDTQKYTIRGVAPDAKIVPIKALWFGDTVYAWMWAAGFDNQESEWKFSGKPRVDILSNSWGISTFPVFDTAPGFDMLSIITNLLVTPGSIDVDYPGIIMVTSAGNSGHGYGTMGFPNTAPYGIAVGATTNNVFVGYGPFKDQPRFGNSTEHYNDIIDFSSRGPSIIGDPKPDLVSIGAYGFTPSSITRLKDSKEEPITLFGGTSMAAPIVSGNAALVIQSLKKNNISYDPFLVKNILMSTATDLKNDPLTQGSGLVNSYDAIKFVEKEEGMFIVHNKESYYNIQKTLKSAIDSANFTAIDIKKPYFAKLYPMTSWYGGQLNPGQRTSATFTIENPSNSTLTIEIRPEIVQLIKTTSFNSTTEPRVKEPGFDEPNTFVPNYYRLSDIKETKNLQQLYQKEEIPEDASLLVVNVHFPFGEFMNKTEKIYAEDMKISSLYLYDWNNQNDDNVASFDELTLVNRGGSWGTVQEVRISNPNEKFRGTPLVGVYPVPTRQSYWIGETKKDSSPMDFTISSTYYKKEKWDAVWVDKPTLTIPPHSKENIVATLVVPNDAKNGVYQGFLKFSGQNHTVNSPVTFAVKNKADEPATLILDTSDAKNILYGNGYVKGAFDMTNRYMTGDWRQYYFDVQNTDINAASVEMSWRDKDTNLSVFVFDPKGKIIQTNVDSGVFGAFMGWVSVDWLGISPFSQGGGFYPIKNKNDTSTVLYIPINQTGIHTILAHNTLFGGQALTEPIKINLRFDTITSQNKAPEIIFDMPKIVNNNFKIQPTVSDENLDVVEYYLDEKQRYSSGLLTQLEGGLYHLKIKAIDKDGLVTESLYNFTLDNTPPLIQVINAKQAQNEFLIEIQIHDENMRDENFVQIVLPNGEIIDDKTIHKIDTTNFEEGNYNVKIISTDLAENESSETVSFLVTKQKPTSSSDQTYLYLIAGIAIGIAIGVAFIQIIRRKN